MKEQQEIEIEIGPYWRQKKKPKKDVYVYACEDGKVWFHDPDYNETLTWTIEIFLKKHEKE